ncbi:MAG: hypothetical protein HY690_11185 [Chloroflexi bacterium]|nr:hypothetical protein [Chloroflexota bacterium]
MTQYTGTALSRPGAPRTLLLIPIVHSQADMGSLGAHLPARQAHGQLAEARWAELQRRVRALELDWPQVKVYQDGLPDAGPELLQKILGEVQSSNYELLRWLVAQGAELVGTESPALLKEEYAHVRAVLTGASAAARAQARRDYAERAAGLLAERDAYMADRIARTLPPGRVGLLFVGQAHHVAEHLPAEVTVRNLLDDRVTDLRVQI